MKNLLFRFGIGVLLSVVAVAPSVAQVGEDNYTGTPGWFKGEVTTGCSYNAYTGGASRSVTDISVAGAVGFPLVFARTSTSRYTAGVATIPTDFGKAGSWQHSYGWSIDTYNGSQSGWPNKFIVNYPDGRRITFTNYNDAYIMAPAGVSGIIDFGYDNFNPTTLGHCYVNLPDGGQVRFSVAISNSAKKFVYTLQSLRDPYGQTTTVTKVGNLMTVTEPAGRMLKIYYGTGPAGDSVITRVEEWMSATLQGRTVQYNYSLYSAGGTNYSALTSVSYKDTPANGQVVYATATYTYQNDNLSNSGRPLLSTADDPMYAGPMRKISYSYMPAGHNPDGTNVVSGQIQSEKSGTTGQAVSTLTVNIGGKQETTGDGRTRTFVFKAGGLVDHFTDFRGKTTSYQYIDGPTGGIGTGFPNVVTQPNGNAFDYGYNNYTHILEGIYPPLTPSDTPQGTTQSAMGWNHGGINCPDPNNRDWYHAYYPYYWQDEAGNQTIYLRDPSKRIVQVNYPDGGTESFTYNNFGEVLTHRLRTGGLETYGYDSRGLLTEYRDAYHLATVDPQHPEVPANSIPSSRYTYDSLDRVASITDALGSSTTDWNHTASYAYNWRGQVTTTTLPIDPFDSQRHTIVNAYNDSAGTLTSVTDQLNHITSYTYDDYRRVRSVTTPGHNTPLTTIFYYDANGTGDDYTHTDANITYMILPSGKKLITGYNENKQTLSVTAVAADGVTDKAITTIGYDDNGNVTSVKSPNEQTGQQFDGLSTTTAYDERNRPMSVTDALTNPTTLWYDAHGRKWKTIRANGQVTTFDSYDTMNRVLQQTVQQAPDPDAVTKWTYYTSGLLQTLKDPRLVATSSNESYNYSYDLMGRKNQLQYPLDSNSMRTTENWRYETRGLVDQFTNRNTKHQTFVYDNLDRLTDTSWDDGGVTPSVHNSYDVASRLTGVRNPIATPIISRVLFNDGLLNSETTTYDDNTPRTVTYSYDSDSNRASILWPSSAYSFTYQYTGRNQLWKILNNGNPVVTYGYDPDGNLTSRAPDNSTSSSFTYDALDRVTHIGHALNGTTRTFDFAYDLVGNRKWTKRDGGTGDVFGYDLNDQSTSILLNIANPDTTAAGNQTISYDANGNRTTFSAYGPTDTYAIDNNSLNQYNTRNGVVASYDANGNMLNGFDTSACTYDAQNRIRTATKAGTTDAFAYDGLNRQVSRTVTGSPIVYNVYDGWNLIGEYASGSTTPSNAYLGGVGGMVKNLAIANRYYYQDANGSTSHLASNVGTLLEWYRYDLQGTPFVNGDQNNHVSSYGVRHLFTGQQWYSEIGLYDLRNRFYSPDIGRFLEADPIGFLGDPTSLYRYVGNDPMNRFDPDGLLQVTIFGGRLQYSGLLTFGYSSTGQWNVGGAWGVATGLVVNVNLRDSAVHAPGWTGFATGSYGRGYGIVGGRITGYWGTDESWAAATGRLGKVSDGLKYNGSWSNTGGSVTFGGGAFIGGGAGYYSRPSSSTPGPATPGSGTPIVSSIPASGSSSNNSAASVSSDSNGPAPSAADVESLSLEGPPIDEPIYGENGSVIGSYDASAIRDFGGLNLGVTGGMSFGGYGGIGSGGAGIGGIGGYSVYSGGDCVLCWDVKVGQTR